MVKPLPTTRASPTSSSNPSRRRGSRELNTTTDRPITQSRRGSEPSLPALGFRTQDARPNATRRTDARLPRQPVPVKPSTSQDVWPPCVIDLHPSKIHHRLSGYRVCRLRPAKSVCCWLLPLEVRGEVPGEQPSCVIWPGNGEHGERFSPAGGFRLSYPLTLLLVRHV